MWDLRMTLRPMDLSTYFRKRKNIGLFIIWFLLGRVFHITLYVNIPLILWKRTLTGIQNKFYEQSNFYVNE